MNASVTAGVGTFPVITTSRGVVVFPYRFGRAEHGRGFHIERPQALLPIAQRRIDERNLFHKDSRAKSYGLGSPAKMNRARPFLCP